MPPRAAPAPSAPRPHAALLLLAALLALFAASGSHASRVSDLMPAGAAYSGGSFTDGARMITVKWDFFNATGGWGAQRWAESC